ncbi:MAG: hypothetical protein QGI77_01150, partial [Roseibacillus sp.]|nr:hypothetical protein [Roseibacillus sp.]
MFDVRHILLISLLGCATQIACAGEVVTVRAPEPAVDRWNYLYNGTPGFRAKGSLFTGLPEDAGGGMDRMGQILIGFDTEALGVQPGRAPESYNVTGVKLTARVANDPFLADPTFVYDPTADPFDALLETGLDPDPGHPVELHGAGFRNGIDSSSYLEGSPPPALGQPPITGSPYEGPDGPTAYPLGFDEAAQPRDVMNNPTEGFNANPWAVGKTNSISPGDVVPTDTVFTFDLDLNQPGVRRYVQEGLSQGQLYFTLTSLQPASFDGVESGNGSFAIFYLKESIEHQLFGDSAPALELSRGPAPSGPIGTEFAFDFARDELTIQWEAVAGEVFEILTSVDLTDWTVL